MSINTKTIESYVPSELRPATPFPNFASSSTSSTYSQSAAHIPTITSTVSLNAHARRSPFLTNNNDTDGLRSNEVDIQVKNLSLSIIPEPSLLKRISHSVTRRAKQVEKSTTRTTTTTTASPTFPTEKNVEDTQIAHGPDLKATDRLEKVGISIFRNVDLQVQPGQGIKKASTYAHGKHTCIHSQTCYTAWGKKKQQKNTHLCQGDEANCCILELLGCQLMQDFFLCFYFVFSLWSNLIELVLGGAVCLIMGGSGSGKTTLLNTLAGRMNPRQTVISGSIVFNDQAPKRYWKSGQIGYLQQEDYLLPFIR